MASLIISIISIALVAVTVLMVTLYINGTMDNAQGQANAAMLIQESRQLMITDTQYMLDKGLSSFNDFGPDAPAIVGYTSGRIPILSLDTNGSNSSFTFTAPLNNSNVRHGVCTNTTPGSLNNNQIFAIRSNGSIFGINVILHTFWATTGSACNASGIARDFSLASMANHPLVQMCKAINAQTKLPPGLTYSASGLPLATGSLIYGAPFWVEYDNVATEINYCFIAAASYWGTGYPDMEFVFAN